jgi:hypothetical protein
MYKLEREEEMFLSGSTRRIEDELKEKNSQLNEHEDELNYFIFFSRLLAFVFIVNSREFT